MTGNKFAVAVRDGDDLFLWMWFKRDSKSDLYYFIPTGRDHHASKKWNPHGSIHRDGRVHHKSFDRKTFPMRGQKPDADFEGKNFPLGDATIVGSNAAYEDLGKSAIHHCFRKSWKFR